MCQPPYLAYLKILHLLDQTIVFLFQHSLFCSIYLQPIIMLTSSLSEDCDVCNHTDRCPRTTQESPTSPNSPPSIFARWNRCRNARHSSGTTAMDNNDMTVKGLRRLFLFFPRLEGRQFCPPSKIACDSKTRGNCPRFRTDIAVGNVRLPVAPFCLTALWLPFLRPPTLRQPGAMVWPSPAAWRVRSAHRHFGQQQRDDDHARRGDNPTPDHRQQLRARPPCTLLPQQRQSTRCLARTVQLLQRKRTRQERFNNNAMIGRETSLKLQFQWRF